MHVQGEGEELVDSEIRGSSLTKEARRSLSNLLHTHVLLLLHLAPMLLVDFLLHNRSHVCKMIIMHYTRNLTG